MNKSTLCAPFLLLLLVGCHREPIRTADDQAQIDVELQIDFGGKADDLIMKHAVPKNSTVLDLLIDLKSDSKLEFAYRGSGATAFVYSLGDFENANGQGSNWVFFVNEQLADRSCGSYRLTDADKVKWVYASKYPPD